MFGLIGLVVIVIIAIVRASQNKKSTTQYTDFRVPTYDQRFLDARQRAIWSRAEDLQIQVSSARPEVFGVVSDWHQNNIISTVVMYRNGDSRVFFSNGSPVIGGYRHDSIQPLIDKTLAEGENHVANLQMAAHGNLPPANFAQFYILTSQGVFTGMDTIQNINAQTSPLYPLYRDINGVVQRFQEINQQSGGNQSVSR